MSRPETAARIYVLAHSLKATGAKNGLKLADLPRFVCEHGFAGLEVSDRQLAPMEEDSLRRLAAASSSARCGLIVDVNVDFTSGDDRLLAAEIAHARRMIGVAADLGAGAIRICLGGQALNVQRFFRRRRHTVHNRPDRYRPVRLLAEKWIMRLGHLFRRSMPARLRGATEKIRRAVAALREVVPMAAASGLPVGIENHWGISGDPANILRIIREVGSPALGACPDLGNFPRGLDAEAGLRLLAPVAVILHAKSYGFRTDGEEKTIDYSRSLAIFRAAGFAGPITVEYEGLGDDLSGCLRTRSLVLRYWNMES